jgi:hypothetical protein
MQLLEGHSARGSSRLAGTLVLVKFAAPELRCTVEKSDHRLSEGEWVIMPSAHDVNGGEMAAKIYEISEARRRLARLEKLQEILGELANRIAIPPRDMPEEEMSFLPASFLRTIHDLTLSELEDLLNGRMKFCILK